MRKQNNNINVAKNKWKSRDHLWKHPLTVIHPRQSSKKTSSRIKQTTGDLAQQYRPSQAPNCRSKRKDASDPRSDFEARRKQGTKAPTQTARKLRPVLKPQDRICQQTRPAKS
mmetsp:Transcript_22129/g.31701  ORF Transcript_22129/g.31701 Transcript_22129/m.31701 type:complete len:113 (+) Transcript_22129:232-570(+)